MWPFKNKPPEVPAVEVKQYRPAMSKGEAAAHSDFYGAMLSDVSFVNGRDYGTRPSPWECVMYYVGVLEERVKKLESEKGE